MQEAFVNINEVPTHVMTWGKWIEESFSRNESEVIICIPGNPGLPGYYTQFLSTLYNNLDTRIPVWIIGQAGHDEPSSSSIRKVPPLSGNESKFNLDGQVKHKLEFIKTYVPSHVKIYLIAHSIGSWMTLKLLEDSEIKDRIKKCYLLFPTIERMAVSPKGTTLKYLRPSIMEKIVFLAREEMAVVKELNVEAVRNNQSLLKLYYGTTDGWVPVKYYDELKHHIPGVDAELDPYQISHTFVLCEAVAMAEIVGEWIRQERLTG